MAAPQYNDLRPFTTLTEPGITSTNTLTIGVCEPSRVTIKGFDPNDLTVARRPFYMKGASSSTPYTSSAGTSEVITLDKASGTVIISPTPADNSLSFSVSVERLPDYKPTECGEWR